MNSMEDNLKGRQPQWKTTLMEDNLDGRRPQWKMTLIEDELNGRQPRWKITSMEEVLNWPCSAPACLIFFYLTEYNLKYL